MLAHPGTARYKDPDWKGGEDCHVIYFLGLFPSALKKEKKEKTSMNLNPAVENFQMTVTSWMDRATGESNWVPGMSAQVKHVKRKDLPAFVADEIKDYEKDVWVPPKVVTEKVATEDENSNGKKRRSNGDEDGDDGVEDSAAASSKKAKNNLSASDISKFDEDDSLVPEHDSILETAATEDIAKRVGGVGASVGGLKVSFAAALKK